MAFQTILLRLQRGRKKGMNAPYFFNNPDSVSLFFMVRLIFLYFRPCEKRHVSVKDTIFPMSC